jgi:glycosyltransferase involved in cell wall biosynthesis
MTSPPLVTVVTPVLNGARYLPELLASVRTQAYPAIEHLVVDGGSTDGTLELLAAARGVVALSGQDQGMYDAINRGFRMARGEYLGYQNADDRYADGQAVARVVEHFERHPDQDVVFGDFRWIDSSGAPDKRRRARRAPRSLDELRHHNVVPPHATFVRARLLREEGFWLDPTLRYAGDWEWFLRLYLAGKRFGHLPAVLADFRVHAAAQTARVPLRNKLAEWRRICRQHHVSFARLCWHELFWQPLRARLRA